MDPVTLGLCSQIDLDFEVQRAAKDRPQVEPHDAGGDADAGGGLDGAGARARAFPGSHAAPARTGRTRSTSNSVFAKLKQLKRPAEDEGE